LSFASAGFEIVELFDQFARAREQAFGVAAESRRTQPAVEQLDAQFRFELADLLADGGGGNEQLLGGAGEGIRIGDGDQGA
jgi:hypothetical protein